MHSLRGAARWQNDARLWLQPHVKVALMGVCVYPSISADRVTLSATGFACERSFASEDFALGEEIRC